MTALQHGEAGGGGFSGGWWRSLWMFPFCTAFKIPEKHAHAEHAMATLCCAGWVQSPSASKWGIVLKMCKTFPKLTWMNAHHVFSYTSNCNDCHFSCTRGLYIIDRKGIIRQITVNDLPVGRNVDEVKRLVQAFQYADKHGTGEDVNNRIHFVWR